MNRQLKREFLKLKLKGEKSMFASQLGYTKEQEKLYQKVYNELFNSMDDSLQDFKKKLESAMASGFHIDFQDSADGYTLLLVSVFAGKPEISKLLLECGADPSIANKSGSCPLDMAITTAQPLDLIADLIYSGANVNAIDVNGFTVFYHAATTCIESVLCAQRSYGMSAAKLLLDNGADPYLCNYWMNASTKNTRELYHRRKIFEIWTKEYLKAKKQAKKHGPEHSTLVNTLQEAVSLFEIVEGVLTMCKSQVLNTETKYLVSHIIETIHMFKQKVDEIVEDEE